ncbi:MAG: MltA domain-containing protein [Acidobacteriota bacterium]
MRKVLFLLLFFCLACSKAVLKPPETEVLKAIKKEETIEQEPLSNFPENVKKIDFEGFLKVLNIIILELENNPEKIFYFDGQKYDSSNYCQKLKTMRAFLQEKNVNEFLKYLSENFELKKVGEESRKTLFTGYYIPLLEARKTKDEIFKYPIYSKPKDIISLKLAPLGPAFKNAVFIGRIDSQNNLVPYFSRKEIEKEGALKNRALELCYLKDPLDLLLLQIQGSGFLKMEDGEILLASYAGKNGREYKSIGKYLSENNFLPPEEVSWDNIRQFLKDNPEKYDEVIYSNPSYVFFDLKEEGNVVGSSKLPLVPLHSIAVDKNYIPLLSLCLINFDKPVVGEDNLVKSFHNFFELAFAMDEGSAIKGAERIDLFCGFGEEAEKLAHTLKSEGEVFILIPLIK